MDMQNLSVGQKDELMDQVKQQIAVANVQELLTVCDIITTNLTQKFSYKINFFTENDIQMLQKVCPEARFGT